MDEDICKKCTEVSGLKRDDCPAKDNDRCHYSPAKMDEGGVGNGRLPEKSH